MRSGNDLLPPLQVPQTSHNYQHLPPDLVSVAPAFWRSPQHSILSTEQPYWHLSRSSTLFIGDGDLTAVLFAFAGNYTFAERSFLGERSRYDSSTLFFINSPIFPFSDFTNKLYPNSKIFETHRLGENICTTPSVKVYQRNGGVNLFQWIVYPDSPNDKPWNSFFLDELKKMKISPNIIFFDGCCTHIPQFFKADIVRIKEWLAKLEVQKKGVLLTAPSHLKSKQLYNLFDQVIEFQPWRKHKCGNRNLVAMIYKMHGEYLKNPIRYHIRSSSKEEIVWEEVGKRYDLFRPIITEGFRAGMTAKQMKEFLQTQYRTEITLPVLAMLKQNWELCSRKRSIRAEKPRNKEDQKSAEANLP